MNEYENQPRIETHGKRPDWIDQVPPETRVKLWAEQVLYMVTDLGKAQPQYWSRTTAITLPASVWGAEFRGTIDKLIIRLGTPALRDDEFDTVWVGSSAESCYRLLANHPFYQTDLFKELAVEPVEEPADPLANTPTADLIEALRDLIEALRQRTDLPDGVVLQKKSIGHKKALDA